MPISLINGTLYEGDIIYNNDIEIGKILINNQYPFALIKFLNLDLNLKTEYKTKNALINIQKPYWF